LYAKKLKSNILNSWKNTYARIRPHIIQNKTERLRVGDFIAHNEILCPTAWGNIQYCYDIHSQFLNDIEKGNVQKYYLENNIRKAYGYFKQAFISFKFI
jgi:hypothetical protein